MLPALLLLAHLVGTPVSAAAPDTVTYTAAPQAYARIEIKHTPLTVRLALGIPKLLLLNLAAGERARLRAVPLLGKGTIKTNLLPGGEVVFRANLYGVAASGRDSTTVPTAWLDKTIADDADGILSVFALNADHVVIVQPGAPIGGTVYSIPRDGRGDATSTVRVGTDAGGEKLHVILDLRSPQTIMNGTAARAVEAAGLVKRGGAVGLWEPFPKNALPYETLLPARGATLLGLPLVTPTARITEARARKLDRAAKAGTSTAAEDADAIVVTAESKRKKREAWVIIGRDVMNHCSRIELDRPGGRWLLTCNFGS